MLDTIRVKVFGEWAPRSLEGWVCNDRCHFLQDDGTMRPSVLYTHEETGLRIGGNEAPSWLECSLPRVLYLNNGRLLDTPGSVVQAWGATKELAANVIDLESTGDPSRVDLVWQFRTNAREVLLAMNGARHPKIRSTPVTFFAETCEWASKAMGLTLRAYDKNLEVNGAPGDVLRCESQMRGKALKAVLASVQSFPFIRWEEAWAAYRKQWSVLPAFRFRDPSLPSPGIAGFLACLDASGAQLYGMPAAEFYLQGKTARHQRRLRNQMSEAAVQELLEFDPAKAFPVEGPPEPVHVEQDAA